MSQPRKSIWILRHGERYDTTDALWKATAKRPHDPHLSRAGIAQGRAAGRLIHQRTLERHGLEQLADIEIYTSPFLRCIQTAKAISTGYYDELTGKQKVEFDVQVKVEHGLAEFLTTLHFTEQTEPLSAEELNQVLEGELDKFYASAQPFPTFPESVSTLYHRLQSAFLSVLSHSTSSNLVFVTHGYGLQVLTEYVSPTTLVTSTDFACITAAEAVKTGKPPVAPEKPQWDHARLIPEPLPCDWDFTCELVCDVAHWKEENAERVEKTASTLANPLPEPEDGREEEKKL